MGNIEKKITDAMAMKQKLDEGCLDTDKALDAARKQLLSAQQRIKSNEKYKTDMPLPAGLDTTQKMLEQLSALKTELLDDLQCITMDLKITIQCKRCTPEKTKVPLHKTGAIQYATAIGKHPKMVRRAVSTPTLNAD